MHGNEQNERYTHMATLVRGKVYYLGNIPFVQNEPQRVTATQKAHLEQNAVDRITIPAATPEEQPEDQHRQKFKFTPLTAEEIGPVNKKATVAVPEAGEGDEGDGEESVSRDATDPLQERIGEDAAPGTGRNRARRR